MNFRNPLYRHIWGLALIDLTLVNVVILGLSRVKFEGSIPEHNLEAYRIIWPWLIAGFFLLFWVQGLYDLDDEEDGISIAFRAAMAVSIGFIVLMAVSFFSRAFAFPRSILLASWAALIVLMGAWRVRYHAAAMNRLPMRDVAFLGSRERGEMLRKFIEEQPGKRFRFAVHCDDDFMKMRAAFKDGKANTAVLSTSFEKAYAFARDLYLEHPGLQVFLVPGIYEIIIGARHHRTIGDIPLVAMTRDPIDDRHLAMKKFMDLALCAVMLAVFSPLLLLSAAIVKLSSSGPVFYLQERVGKNGRLFKVIKFRTMIVGAEDQTGPTLSSEEDPRVTPVGRFLRKTRLDELPQIINVLKGDMSLVGPRPERPFFVERYEKTVPGFAERKQTLPGLTGLAQINGRYDSDPENKIKYDLLYIYNYQPLMDIAIIYRTLQRLIREWV